MSKHTPYRVPANILARAIEKIIAEESVGLADCEISAFLGVPNEGKEVFPIETVEVWLKRREAAKPKPISTGKLRLAAVDGLAVQ